MYETSTTSALKFSNRLVLNDDSARDGALIAAGRKRARVRKFWLMGSLQSRSSGQ